MMPVSATLRTPRDGGVVASGRPSAAADFARRPCPRNEATGSRGLPWLVRLVFWCFGGRGRGSSADGAVTSTAALVRAAAARASSFCRQQCLYLRPEPQ